MRILEVIHLRMAGGDLSELARVVRATVADAANAPDVRIYRHARVEGDLLIHLHRDGSDEKDEPSTLGLRLASLLRIYGMVGHSVWIRRGEQDAAVEASEFKGI